MKPWVRSIVDTTVSNCCLPNAQEIKNGNIHRKEHSLMQSTRQDERASEESGIGSLNWRWHKRAVLSYDGIVLNEVPHHWEGDAPAKPHTRARRKPRPGLMNQRFVKNSMQPYKPEAQASIFSQAIRLACASGLYFHQPSLALSKSGNHFKTVHVKIPIRFP